VFVLLVLVVLLVLLLEFAFVALPCQLNENGGKPLAVEVVQVAAVTFNAVAAPTRRLARVLLAVSTPSQLFASARAVLEVHDACLQRVVVLITPMCATSGSAHIA